MEQQGRALSTWPGDLERMEKEIGLGGKGAENPTDRKQTPRAHASRVPIRCYPASILLSIHIQQESGWMRQAFGGVAQLVRACGSYPQSPGFKSLHRHHQNEHEKKIALAIFFLS